MQGDAARAGEMARPDIAHLPDDKLDCLDPGEELWLEAGATNTVEVAPATHFFVVLDGELLISKRIDAGQQARVDTFGPGVFYGEMPLLLGTGYPASGVALTRCHLFRLDRDAFLRLLPICPEVMGAILQTMAARMQALQQFSLGREKLAALGTPAAGLAHELNNPAAARRAADQLRDTAPLAQARGLALGSALRPEELTILAEIQACQRDEAPASRAAARRLGTLDRADREGSLADWLGARDIAEPWEIAPTLVAAGLDVATLDRLAGHLAAPALPAVVGWLALSLEASELTGVIEHSTGRIAELVRAIKEYSYLDQAPTQEVDLHDGIENTLTILGHKLKGVSLVREYDRRLPPIPAHGGALNQVWTNLLTKAVGAGSGLGLAVSYRIVVHEHGGDLQVASSPGETHFRVWLPLGTVPAVQLGTTPDA